MPRVPQTNNIWKKLLALPQGIRVTGMILLAVVIVWFLFLPDRKEAPQTPTSPQVSTAENIVQGQTAPTAATPEPEIPFINLAFLQSVRLRPFQPTRLDSLKAEIVAAPTAPRRLTYAYRWKVNNHLIRQETGDTLNLAPFKKGDLITVTVTPNDGVSDGFAVESPLVAVYSIPPSLELKAVRQVKKTGIPIHLQLTSTAPDSDRLVFNLEPPLVPGMNIDENSGEISWDIQPDQKGAFRFGAGVTDDNGTKVTNIFDINVD
jgi:hypothetical protein